MQLRSEKKQLPLRTDKTHTRDFIPCLKETSKFLLHQAHVTMGDRIFLLK